MSEIELHRKLLGDQRRNQAFHESLRQLIRPGETEVVDLGAGTGFLSFLARRLGAKHCTLVEYSDALELAQQLARTNRIDGLSFVRAHSSELRKPPKADLVVSETLGNYALEENLLETLIDARRFLKPGGRIIPGRLRQYVAPVVTPRLQDEIDIWAGVGFGLDLGKAREISLNNMYVKTIAPADLGGDTSRARLWDELDFAPEAKAPPSRRSRRVQWPGRELDGARVSGFALWWECELVPGIALDTAPFSPPTHWEQIYLPLLDAVEPGADATLELELASDTGPQVGVRLTWTTRLLRRGKAQSEHRQDSLRGRL